MDDKFEIVRLGSDTTSVQVAQFVGMMQRMYEFHATLHTDWQPKPNWQQGSQDWIKHAGSNEDYFFAVAYPLNAAGDVDPETAPAGYIIAHFHYEAPLFVQNRFGYIADLWVETMYRQQGVAREILAAANSWFKTQGTNRVQIEVDVENAAGQKFWHGIGYKDFEIVMRADI